MQDGESIREQTSSVTAINSSSWRRIAIAIVITTLVAGTIGYLLGARANQNTSHSTPRVSFQPLPTITSQSSASAPSPSSTHSQPPPITRQKPTSSLISDGFVNWKTHKSYFGYSIKYPATIEFRESEYFDFELVNQDLVITFITGVLPEEREAEEYVINNFCFAKKEDIRKEKVNDVSIYRSEKVYDKNKPPQQNLWVNFGSGRAPSA